MATTFFISNSSDAAGYSTLFVRLQSRRLSLNYKLSSGLKVDASLWRQSHMDIDSLRRFRKEYRQLWDKLDSVKMTLDFLIKGQEPPTREQVRRAINDIVFSEVQLACGKHGSKGLRGYIDLYLDEISDGVRTSARGNGFAANTVRTIRSAAEPIKRFLDTSKREYDFEDINISFYNKFTAWLRSRGYKINTVGKIIKQFKTIMAAAEADGLHRNQFYKHSRFRVLRAEVEAVYLTQEEIDAIARQNIDKLGKVAEICRDIFMVGVWTAQRVSDYNSIGPESIHVTKHRWVEDVPSETGKTTSVIREKEITYVDIRQKKTGVKVSIPCRSNLKAIFEKYKYKLPHIDDRVLNREIKRIAHAAGIVTPVSIETTRGFKTERRLIEKYKLITSHTARRTGATLMYLAGIDIYDIMKITGHSTPEMLKRYIRADNLDTVLKLTQEYDWFD